MKKITLRRWLHLGLLVLALGISGVAMSGCTPSDQQDHRGDKIDPDIEPIKY